ncbi:peptidylprolyl isomerase [Tamlana sp. 2_MG-2023]|uniref:peptidylprolyl isomerase n=1 Tax=unclassified Tamlana TaxID=2614803 RepID=UPI0026E32CDB|nr:MULTISPECIES: peptidylprolyl isomerase [unclassified Tamlana]MDO6760438.1 peptidylprolyl isomerase [Tamlana sp. 2_MG-2023]MDO6789863.1 peptidylprolyl isomerase [Tamlana sp. 1_MG-2023]
MNLAKNTIKVILLILCFNFTSCKAPYPELEDGIYAEFDTSKGIMVARLELEKAPVTVANFVSLAEGTNTVVKKEYKDKKYFDGSIFHRVMNDFMIQGGDPTGTGKGDPGYRFMDEFHPDLKHDKAGVLSMANPGKNTNGSQFFFTDTAKPHLDHVHTVFGEVIIGLDVLDSISNVKTNAKHRPIKEVVLKHVTIIRKGKKAKSFNAPKVFEEHFAERERLAQEKIDKAAATLIATHDKFEAQRAKATKLDSGLQFYISEKGTGKKLPKNAKALVDYSVFFVNGELIETSKIEVAEALGAVNKKRKFADKYHPIIAELKPNAHMIPGFKEGLQQLHVGDKATLFIPHYLAYGDSGTKGIPGKSNLIFEVDILELLK